MKKSILVLIIATVILMPFYQVYGAVSVKGYYKANGTYVKPYIRSNPDGVFGNNFSTKGNVNPYTGVVGTKVTPSTNVGSSIKSNLSPSTSLGVGIIKVSSVITTFTLGSQNTLVKTVMGTPSSIESNAVIGDIWYYHDSSVDFDTYGKVKGWNNVKNQLRVSMGNKVSGSPKINIGFTTQQVVSAMGTPSSLFPNLTSGSTWFFGYSSIEFDLLGKVISWNNYSSNLLVE